MNPAIRSIALVGNPNCGKTALFNRLTGARQTVGNWPGVTVEKKTGSFALGKTTLEVVDLPGIYTLSVAEEGALDEAVSRTYLLSHEADCIINVVDACNLERNLYLTTQLLDMGVPLVLAVNMLDLAEKKGLHLDLTRLSQELGCPVIPVVATERKGAEALLKYLKTATPSASRPFYYGNSIERTLQTLSGCFSPETPATRWRSTALLEGDPLIWAELSPSQQEEAKSIQATLESQLNQEADIVMAESRYQPLTPLCQKITVARKKKTFSGTARLDSVVLNRFLGLPIFLGVMYLLFMWTMHIGGAFIDFFNLSAAALFVDGLDTLLTHAGLPEWARLIFTRGLGAGIQTVCSFIPLIGFLYLFLSFLEDSGYMARAAFVIDRLMRSLGLPGKAFVPMIVGFGCNVPAVMGSRTLETPRDRKLAIMMTPFISCGARLPVYALFAAAFFPNVSGSVVFLLYLTGLLVAIFTGLLLKHTILPGGIAPLVLELPAYHVPNVRSILLHTWERLRGFVIRAGALIVPMVMVLNLLASVNPQGQLVPEKSEASLLAGIGRSLTPLFSPMGLKEDNWQATVGIFTGILAKEAVVGTLNTLYSGKADKEDAPKTLGTALLAAWNTVPEKLGEVLNKLSDPLGIQKATSGSEEKPNAEKTATYASMHQHFAGAAGAMAYLFFILLYTPCTATLSAIYREIGMRWMIGASVWGFAIAYGVATAYYQWGHSVSLQTLSLAAAILMILGLFLPEKKAKGFAQIPVVSVGSSESSCGTGGCKGCKGC